MIPIQSVAAQAVRDAIADIRSNGSMPTDQEVAAAGLKAAIDSILPSRIAASAALASDPDRLTRHAFLALASELRGRPLPDASREALAEQFPALGPAPATDGR